MNEEVGGIPYLLTLLKRFLPKDKGKRKLLIQVTALVLTYVVYVAFKCVRHPNSVLKTRIIHQCNITYEQWRLNKHEFNEQPRYYSWCDDITGDSTVERRMGQLDALYILFYAISVYICGMVVDRYNPRYFLSAGCILCGFLASMIGLAQTWVIEDYNYLTMTLILFGAAQATGWPVVLSCATHWYSGSRRGLFFGFWNTHKYLGSLLGFYIAGIYVEEEWGWCFYIPAFIILAMSFITFSLFVADPSDLQFLNQEKAPPLPIEADLALPSWMRSKRSINFIDALRLPGVMEFSGCLFFTQLVSSAFLGWLPTCVSVVNNVSAKHVTIYPLGYLSGACLGGLLIGAVHDKFRKSAFVSSVFLLLSIPSIYGSHSVCQQAVPENQASNVLFLLWLGFLLEAPVIVISTSISAELGTHKLIKRDHSAMATVAGILEGTGALGQMWTPIIFGYFVTEVKWIYMIYLMMVVQFLAMMCLVRLAYRDVRKKTDYVFIDYARKDLYF